MTSFRLVFIAILFLISFTSKAQTVSLIGTSEEFILENVKGYASFQARGIEHEEFDVLVFEDKDRELSFYFTFYRGEKICSYIKNRAPISALKEEIDFIKTNFKNIKDNIWENASKAVQVQVTEFDGQGTVLAKAIRN